ncbi:J-domain-containing protein [Chengkuizengella axinellae]|uniref:DnaJ family domain-containing protein n=1 Tax=Chengkuizengella axinellae TaxID=3064388 RepID=UPI003527C198
MKHTFSKEGNGCNEHYFNSRGKKIREAKAKGEFDNLPGKGKKLELEDLSHIPNELRMSYKILKNAGIVPVEMQLKKEIVSLQDLIDLRSVLKEVISFY